VTTFLDFTRPVEVHFENVDLAALAREVANSSARKPPLPISRSRWPPPSPPPCGDPDLLKQAILNLVTNAVEAMSVSGGNLRSVERAASN
jgi:signal transduction histidine kinase